MHHVFATSSSLVVGEETSCFALHESITPNVYNHPLKVSVVHYQPDTPSVVQRCSPTRAVRGIWRSSLHPYNSSWTTRKLSSRFLCPASLLDFFYSINHDHHFSPPIQLRNNFLVSCRYSSAKSKPTHDKFAVEFAPKDRRSACPKTRKIKALCESAHFHHANYVHFPSEASKMPFSHPKWRSILPTDTPKFC